MSTSSELKPRVPGTKMHVDMSSSDYYKGYKLVTSYFNLIVIYLFIVIMLFSTKYSDKGCALF